MSQWTSHRDHPVNLTRQTSFIDHLFADLPGIAHTILNPGMFADNFLRTIDFAALVGSIPSSAARRKPPRSPTRTSPAPPSPCWPMTSEPCRQELPPHRAGTVVRQADVRGGS